jgi:branched-chain amino acid transport system permease protein
MSTPTIPGFDPGPLRDLARWRPRRVCLLAAADRRLFRLRRAALAAQPDRHHRTVRALARPVLGYAGIVSLGHAAFFGIGAYAAGLMATHGWNDPLLGLLGAGRDRRRAGFVSSFLVLRGSDLTRLMVTLGVALMLFELANKLTSITGGVDGLQGIEMKPIFGLFSFDLYGKTAYIYSVAVLFILFWIARRIVHSPFGLSLRGIRLNVLRMPALGAPVNARLVRASTLGAAYAGIAGALLTQTTQFVSIDALSFSRSAELLLILVLGGTGSLYGALIGTAVFMTAHHMLSGINPEYWQFWLGMR